MSEIDLKPFSDDILRDAPPLEYDDFEDIRLHAADIKMIEEFEKLWDEHLEANPHTIPTGKKGQRIRALQDRAVAVQLSKQKVQAELQRQLDFFATARDEMTETFERAKAKSLKEHTQITDEMKKKLDDVGCAWRNTEANGPWDLFFDALEDAVEQSDVQQLPGEGLSTILGISSHVPPTSKNNIMKPSAHAMFLNNAAEESDALVKSRDFLLRAYRIDNALLQANVKALQRDVEKSERTMDVNEFVGNFLTEHNIFAILSSSHGVSQPSVVPADESILQNDNVG